MTRANGSGHLIRVSDVDVTYPSDHGGQKVVLNGINLPVKSGEFVTVVGPSGCGKSTLLRLVLGSQLPSCGTVMVSGEQVYRLDRERGIVYQKYSLFPNRTVLDNIAVGPLVERTNLAEAALQWVWPRYRRERRVAREEAAKYLRHVGLTDDDAQQRPHELSGGMRQRVAIAQALIMKPKVLCMDEPFGALDVSTREDVQLFTLEQWQEHGMTVFFVTHELEEACFMGTRIIGLSQYYTDGDGSQAGGAKITLDLPIPGPHPKSPDAKYTPEFQALVRRVKRDVLDPKHLQHVSEFALQHPDAWQAGTEGLDENRDKR